MRGQYFGTDDKDATFVENLMRYGNKFQAEQDTQQQSLFGGDTSIEITKPQPSTQEDWQKLEKLNKEKELIGIYLSAHPLDDYKFEIDNFTNTKCSELNNPESVRGRDLNVAGIVIGVRNAMTKTGKPFGSLTIQDYTDSYQIMLFGKDYENFRKYVFMDYPLMIKGRIQPRPYNDQELEFKITSIRLLSQVREELVKSLTIKLQLSSLTDGFIQNLTTISENHQGKVQLKFKVFDNDENLAVEMFSRNKSVDVTNELLNELDQISDIQYSVN